MKFRYTYLIWAGCLWLGVAGCASSGMNKKVAVTPVRTLTPDSMSTVGVDVNIHIPEKAFTGRTRLIGCSAVAAKRLYAGRIHSYGVRCSYL